MINILDTYIFNCYSDLMLIMWKLLLIIVNTMWLGLVFFALPGNWLMIATTCLFAWWAWDERVFSISTLVFVTVLAIIGEIIEFFAGMGGARKAGSTWKAAFGAIAGTIIGGIVGTFTIPIPLIGTLLGACIGAGLATLIIEINTGKDFDHSFRTGVGAGIGVFIGTGSKILIGILIWLIITIAALV